jgi:hypothetical protein
VTGDEEDADTSASTDEAQSPEELLEDLAELLFRQVHPKWIDDGSPTSQAFVPTKKDAGALSIARGSLTTAERAFQHHTTVLNLESAGSWAVTVGEAETAGLRSFGERPTGNPHGFIDFRELGRKASERAGKILLARARDRGCLHPAGE